MNATPESIALAAGILTQTRGDVAQARRAATEATEWLQSIDPAYKAPAPPQVPEDWEDQLAELRVQREDWIARAKQFCQERDQARRDAAKLPDLTADIAAWRERAERAERALEASKPATPVPTAQPVKPATPATPATPAADPFAGLPPKMRAFLAAQQGKGLEID